MTSIFTDKETTPSLKDLKKAVGNSFSIWQVLVDYTKTLTPRQLKNGIFLIQNMDGVSKSKIKSG